ncbi:MAG: FHA domain-containing protein, partial [Gemmatimonadales bacterium]
MRAQFKFLSGARAGEVETFRKGYIGVGRHPLSDVRFDTERDLDVSARHAAVIRRGDRFVVQDLNSRNGTFVNRQRIDRDTPLADGDVIGFGSNGPALEFRSLPADDVEPAAIAAASSGPPIAVAPPVDASGGPPRRSSTAVRVAMEVARQTRSLRRTTTMLVGALILTAMGFAALRWWDARLRDRELAGLQARADSLSRASQVLLARLQSEMVVLHDALASANTEAGRLRRELAAAPDAATVARLRAALDAAERR